MVQRADDNQSKTNGASDVVNPYLGTGIDHAMCFDIRDVADISVPNVVPAEVSVKESNGKEYDNLSWKSTMLICYLQEQVGSELTVTSLAISRCGNVH
jgi:hypothetical protein